MGRASDCKSHAQYWFGFESQSVRQESFLPDCRLPVQALLRSPYSPRLHSLASNSICAHVKNPKYWQPYHCFETRKYCNHLSPERVTLLLRLLCFTQVRGLEYPLPKGQWCTIKRKHTHTHTHTKKKKKKKKKKLYRPAVALYANCFKAGVHCSSHSTNSNH